VDMDGQKHFGQLMVEIFKTVAFGVP
jgi:hypothetical protein